MAKDVPEQDGSAEIPPLTEQEKVVLQAIYDHFRRHGARPTFITIDRPIAEAASGAVLVLRGCLDRRTHDPLSKPLMSA
jgi:hypothetical protein